MMKVVSFLFIVISVSCHSRLNDISIIFEANDDIILTINADDQVKYYQKEGRIRGISINSEQLSIIEKSINKIKFVSVEINNKEVYRVKWFTIPNPNFVATKRASIFQSIDGSQSALLIFCDDNSIEFTNCTIESELNNELLNYLKKQNQLYSFDESELKAFKRINYMKLINQK